MFYDIENRPSENPQKEYFLLNNFLDKIGGVTAEITEMVMLMSVEVTDELKNWNNFSVKDIMDEHFKTLINAKRDFGIEQVINSKELYTKLSNNGLVGEILDVKLVTLDWLWEKVKENYNSLRDGTKSGLFNQIFNQLKSLLTSLLKALGLPTDIFEENFDLLISLLEMAKQENRE